MSDKMQVSTRKTQNEKGLITRFTPGPWHVDDTEPWFTLNRLLIESETTHQTAICALNFHADPDECRANANLIASAPKMYDGHGDAMETMWMINNTAAAVCANNCCWKNCSLCPVGEIIRLAGGCRERLEKIQKKARGEE